MHPNAIPAATGPVREARIFGAIPARYGSTRLAAKALAPIAGRPMIQHVYERAARASGLERLVVLTDDERIGRVVEGFGGDWQMTPADCASGTDRVAWAARQWPATAIVNIQGDEPLVDPDGVSRLAAHLAAHPEDPIATLASDAEPGDRDNPNAVKVVLDGAGYALYFSRAGIPYARQPSPAKLLLHLGIYGYQRSALQRLAALPPTPLEISESLEQLRALENGLRIRVLLGARASRGVDTLEDLRRVEALLAAAPPRP